MLVNVPVVVLDRYGHAIGNLTKEDFRVFDEGKLQAISGFSVRRTSGEQREGAAENDANALDAAPADSNRRSRRFIAVLFDDVHLTSPQVSRIRGFGSHLLSQMPTDFEMIAVLSTSGQINTGFTHDRAKLENAILSLQARPVSVGSHVECPQVDHYDALMILTQHDPEALAAASDQGCSPDKKMDEGMARAAAAWELQAGERSTHISLDVIRQVVSQMARLPGERALVLVSPGFIAMTPEAMKDEAKVFDSAAAANVTVSTLNARGLEPRTMDIEKRP